MTNIDLKRLAVDRGYWDSVAPGGATHCGAKHGKAEWWMRKGGLVYERNGALWNERLMWPKNLIPRPTKQEWEGGLPPVGCECEFVFNRMWVSAKVVGYDGPACVVAIDGEGYEGSRNPSDFRPVKSQHERLRGELAHLIDENYGNSGAGIADAILSRYNLESKQ